MDKFEKHKNRMASKMLDKIEKLKNRQQSSNAGYQLIDPAYNVREGTIKYGKGVTLNHLLAMTKVSWMLKRRNIKHYTELIFKKECGIGRADIFCPTTMVCFEILQSEDLSKFKDIKLANYPAGLEIIPLKAEDVLKEGFKID